MKLDASPKAVMAIALMAMLGLLFGAVGYLVFNKPKINPPVVITPAPAEEKVAISTDKTGYEQGETVKITVRNSLNKSIWDFAHCGPNPFWNLQKFDGNEWKELNFSLPHQDPRQKKEKEICDFVMCERPELTELKPNLEINYDWSIATICEWPLSPIGMPTTEPKIIKEGTYRVVIAYGFSKDSSFSEGKTIYSNEFTIKEKAVQNREVTISTDKTEYEQGESVKFTLINNFSKSIWYVSGAWECNTKPYEIYNFSANKWGKILTYAPICSAVEGAGAPIYKELLPNDSLIFDWNQELWDYNTDAYNAKAGKYKISMKYKNNRDAKVSDNTIYSNEFTIKGKTSEVLTIDYVLKHSEELTNKTISVKGTANNNKNKVVCTKGPGCNKCDSPLILEEGGQSIEISGRIINTPIICTGTDCEGIKECKPLTKDKSYIVTGIWNGKSLDIESWTEKSAVDPRCGQKVEGITITGGNVPLLQCPAMFRGYEFDASSGKCVERTVGGCKAEIPFNSLEECQKVCEKKCRDESYKCTIEDIPCCNGLKEVLLSYEDEEGKCFPPVPCGSMCLPCGNGRCDERENKCNCPEDCK